MSAADVEFELEEAKAIAQLKAENAFLIGIVAGMHSRLDEQLPDWVRRRIDEIYIESHPLVTEVES
jgi:hypothetical protein